MWLTIVFAGLSACPLAAVDASTLSVFMSPEGTDAADGRTVSTAVQTFQRALDIGIAAAADNTTRIAIEVGEGVYLGQRATIAERPKGIPISIRRSRTASKAVFDGDGKGGVWLVVRPSPDAGRLSVTNLEIRNYITAVSLSGSRDDPKQSVADVELASNWFRHIGQVALPRGKPSTAAVRLVNADKTRIVRNRFVDIRNVRSCGSLHAIYLAHDSTDNLIEANHFENGCGDAIRLRDRSSRNVIKGNKFIDAWAEAPVSDWYCNSSTRKDCTKATPECPSAGNVVAGNSMVARKSKRVDLMKSYELEPNAVCGPESGPRFLSQ